MRSILTCFRRPKTVLAVKLGLILLSLTLLRKSDCYFSNYLLLALGALWALLRTAAPPLSRRQRRLFALGGVLYGLMVVLANHALWSYNSLPSLALALLRAATAFAGCFVTARELLGLLFTIGERTRREEKPLLSRTGFGLLAFGLMAVIYLTYLLLCQYPGNLSVDSIKQVRQIVNGSYSNYHPYYHTIIIRLLVRLGTALFGDLNAGVACYSAFQALLFSAAVTYLLLTLWDMKAPRALRTAILLFFALTPYNIAFSVTMWKDVPFSAAAAVMVCAFLRLAKGLSLCRTGDGLLLALSALGFCVWRTNGFFAFCLLFAVVTLCCARRRFKLWLGMAGVLALSWVLLNPVLQAMNIPNGDVLESLSIPLQQIGRVLADGEALSAKQTEELGRFIPVEKIADYYDPVISDPLKNLVRDEGNLAYITEHVGDFLRIWLQVVREHPAAVVRGYLDQTRGYYNSGTDYWIYYEDVIPNELGLERTTRAAALHRLKDLWGELFKQAELFEPLRSPGLLTWLLLFALLLSAARRDSSAALLAAPALAVVATLLVATPVSCEFRYAFTSFTTGPVVMAAALYPIKSKEEAT